ncbi:MAG: murein transglycosylase A [Burkholderiales bacterium]
MEPARRLAPVSWSALPGWNSSAFAPAMVAFLRSCAVLVRDPRWTQVCNQSASLTASDQESLRAYFETWFTPFKIADGAGNAQGLLTGYYEPLLRGSRIKQAPYIHPVYAVPQDLVRIELSALYPELAHQRLRGRLVGNKVVPYASRAVIDAGQTSLAGQEILWVDDTIALFFLHIQGSGKVALDSGETLRLAYGDQNGHPYRAIGKTLVERGALQKEEVSLQSIRAWLQRNPESAALIMNTNPSYVFFEEQPDSADGPKGAQGVALTAGHSIAVDPRNIPLGAPVYIESTWPPEGVPLNLLSIAQDTGGAIRGAVRADLFLGQGLDAEETAGRMRQPLRAWVLLPKGWKD